MDALKKYWDERIKNCTNDEPLPCFWCGGTITYVQTSNAPTKFSRTMYQVSCGVCGICGQLSATEKNSIELWNTLVITLVKMRFKNEY